MATRLESWNSLLTDALIEREATDRGARLVLRSSPEVRRRLEELIVLESHCCAWMTLAVSEKEALTVDITASKEIGRRAVRELFLTTPWRLP